jgi:hypothetical protein
MSHDIGTEKTGARPPPTLASPAAPPGHAVAGGDARALASAFEEHKTAYLRALDYQEEDFLRFSDDRLAATRNLQRALESCTSWSRLIGLQADWARDESQACLIEARRLILHAGLIRHPDWLARQTRAGRRASF